MATPVSSDHAAAVAFQFATPARIVDFPSDPTKQNALNQQWNTNLNGFTQQTITGNPWNATNAAGVTNYFNPAVTPPPPGSTNAPIEWGAYPGRIPFYCSQLTPQDQLSLADTGYQTNGKSFPPITTDPCSGAPINLPYGPYGPRGWQDEYCEWSVTRNDKNQIVRVDFTCENPEYWNTLWMIDPNQVLTLYRATLNKPQIQLTDLQLYNGGTVVIDPSTGRPAYNPLNRWNNGPVSTSSAGGAMHLTSTPNTLQTEIGLAGAATIQRTVGNNDPNTLICCAEYGQPHRNSDPHIGQVTNAIVQAGNTVSLTNPPGLYIQMPDFSGYKTPNGMDASTFWSIVRGSQTLNADDGTPLPGNFILHASFEVPANLGFTVSDIMINGTPITWGGQIAQTFTMQIVATAMPATAPAAVACVGTPPPAQTFAQPLQVFHQSIFNAMYGTSVTNPVGQPMVLLSNSTLIAPLIMQGSAPQMVLTCATVQFGPNGQLPNVGFAGTDIVANVIKTMPITYAVPGNSYPSAGTALFISVAVANQSPLGLRAMYVTNYGQPLSTAMPALVNVVPAGSITIT